MNSVGVRKFQPRVASTLGFQGVEFMLGCESPGLKQPWVFKARNISTLKAFANAGAIMANAFSVEFMLGCESPGLKQPWAGISERLWRYVRERCTTAGGTEDVDHYWRNVGAGPLLAERRTWTTAGGTWALDPLLAERGTWTNYWRFDRLRPKPRSKLVLVGGAALAFTVSGL